MLQWLETIRKICIVDSESDYASLRNEIETIRKDYEISQLSNGLISRGTWVFSIVYDKNWIHTMFVAIH